MQFRIPSTSFLHKDAVKMGERRGSEIRWLGLIFLGSYDQANPVA